MSEQIQLLAQGPSLVEQAIAHAQARRKHDLAPTNEALRGLRKKLQDTESQINALTQTLVSGATHGANLRLLTEKGESLEAERNGLRLEARKLEEFVSLATTEYDGIALQQALLWFNTGTDGLNPAQRQQALRWLVKGVNWGVDGKRTVLFYGFKTKNGEKKNQPSWEANDDWFDTILRTGCPVHRSLKPVILRAVYSVDNAIREELSKLFSPKTPSYTTSA
jgi:hypothetical protein